MCTIKNRIHPLRLVIRGDSARLVLSITSTRLNEDAVRLRAIYHDWCTRSEGQVVIVVRSTAGSTLHQVVAMSRLIVDDRDQAGRALAECILCSSIGDSTSGLGLDDGRLVVGSTFDLVQVAIVVGVQRTSCGEGGDAGSVASSIDVARSSSDQRGQCHKA